MLLFIRYRNIDFTKTNTKIQSIQRHTATYCKAWMVSGGRL